MEINEITSFTKDDTIELEIGANKVQIAFKWRPHAWTPELEKEAREAAEQDTNSSNGKFYASLMAPTLAWIDLQKGGEDIVKPDTFEKDGLDAAIAAVSRVPNNVLLLVINKISERNDPGKKPKGRSGGSFSE